MKIQLTIIAAAIFIFSGIESKAANDSIAENIFRLIYNEQFEEAEYALTQSQLKIETFYIEILTTDLYWWKYVKSNNKEESKKLLEQIAFLEQSTNSTEGRIKQLVAKSYQIRYFLKKYNIVGATVVKSEIKNLLAEIYKNKPLTYPDKRLELLYIYESLFVYFDNLFNPFFLEKKRTNRDNSLKNIEKYAKSDDLIAQTLSNYFLGKIFLNIENEPEKGIACFKLLTNKYPNNEIFAKLLLACEEKINSTDFSGYNQY